MPVIHHKPAARGVNQLMYVGDDAATSSNYSILTVALLALGAAWLLFGRRG